MRFVFDASSLLEIPFQCSNHNHVLNELTELIQAEEATFCDPVREEIARKAKDEPIHVWIKAVEKQRCENALSPDWARVRWVQEQVTGLVDEDGRYEQSVPYVIAQAYELREVYAYTEVWIVTEETADKPTRKGLGTACDELALPYVTLLECLSDYGIDPDYSAGSTI